MLKVTQQAHNVPKLLVIDANGRLPANHRDQLSARYLYENFHSHKSFVANNFVGQKEVHIREKIPFGLSNFVELIQNSYFYTQQGEEAKVMELDWSFDSDSAEVDYWVRKPYTKNLQETLIEPGNI